VHRARLTHYIENRSEVLASINEDKGAAKQLLLSCLFGGDPSREFAAAEGDPTASLQGEAAPFCAEFAAECRGLAAAVWAMAPELHGLKLGKNRKVLRTRHNREGILLSYSIFTRERECLEAFVEYMGRNKRTVGCLIHDGCLVERLEGETDFPTELLTAAGEYVLGHTDLSMQFISKAIVSDYAGPEKGSLTPYQAMKASFEETHFMLDEKNSRPFDRPTQNV
jgi:hypothetical protein